MIRDLFGYIEGGKGREEGERQRDHTFDQKTKTVKKGATNRLSVRYQGLLLRNRCVGCRRERGCKRGIPRENRKRSSCSFSKETVPPHSAASPSFAPATKATPATSVSSPDLPGSTPSSNIISHPTRSPPSLRISCKTPKLSSDTNFPASTPSTSSFPNLSAEAESHRFVPIHKGRPTLPCSPTYNSTTYPTDRSSSTHRPESPISPPPSRR